MGNPGVGNAWCKKGLGMPEVGTEDSIGSANTARVGKKKNTAWTWGKIGHFQQQKGSEGLGKTLNLFEKVPTTWRNAEGKREKRQIREKPPKSQGTRKKWRGGGTRKNCGVKTVQIEKNGDGAGGTGQLCPKV